MRGPLAMLFGGGFLALAGFVTAMLLVTGAEREGLRIETLRTCR